LVKRIVFVWWEELFFFDTDGIPSPSDNRGAAPSYRFPPRFDEDGEFLMFSGTDINRFTEIPKS
jgi:hypothetical protein